MTVTNVVVEKHNAWTLTKHAANSINNAAGKLDAKLYGTKTNIIVKPDPIIQEQKSSAYDAVMAIVGIILFVVILGAWALGAFRGRDIIGF